MTERPDECPGGQGGIDSRRLIAYDVDSRTGRWGRSRVGARTIDASLAPLARATLIFDDQKR